MVDVLIKPHKLRCHSEATEDSAKDTEDSVGPVP